MLNWRYDAIHGARECQRASIFFPAPLQLHVYTCIIIIQGVKLVVGTKLLAPAKLIFNTPEPVPLHRYKRERNPAQSTGQAS